jgi:hypothetical protein
MRNNITPNKEETQSKIIKFSYGSAERKVYDTFFSQLASPKAGGEQTPSTPPSYTVKELLENTTGTKSTIESPFRLLQPERIKEFLSRNEFLLPFLLELYGVVLLYFPDAEMSLELVSDMDVENEVLLANIISSMREAISFQRFEKFRYNWWLDNLDRVKSKLLVTVIT